MCTKLQKSEEYHLYSKEQIHESNISLNKMWYAISRGFPNGGSIYTSVFNNSTIKTITPVKNVAWKSYHTFKFKKNTWFSNRLGTGKTRC